MERIDLEIHRGDTSIFNVDAKRPDPSNPSLLLPINMTAGKAWFTAKRSVTDVDASAAIALSTATAGVAILNALGGQLQVTIPAAATVALPDDSVVLVYDVQVKDAAGVVTTVQWGKLTVDADVTRATI